jgi:hypothetical protein
MKISLSGSRSLAISVIAGLFGWMIIANDSRDPSHYQAMSKDAIIAELTSKHIGAAGMLTFCLILILAIVVGVDVLTNFFDAIWQRIGLPPDGSTPPTV